MKSVFFEVIYNEKPILINSDHIISISPGLNDTWWLCISHGQVPIEITREQKERLISLKDVVKL